MIPKVLLACPNTGNIHKCVVRCIIGCLSDPSVRVTYIDPTHNPYENNMHHIISDFLDGDYDYLVSIDSDNPPQKNPMDLVHYDLDIIGCPTPIIHTGGNLNERPYYFNSYDWVPDKNAFREHVYNPSNGDAALQEVDAVGSGCIVVARRVLENIHHPWMRRFDDRGRVIMGGDLSFCRKAKDKGFKVYSHYDYICEHLKNVPLLELIQKFNNTK